MAFLKPKSLLFPLIIMMASLCHSGSADGNNNDYETAQTVSRAMSCFNNKYIYDGCNAAYRLTESGELKVPPLAMELFCRGPCLVETQMVLNCVDDMFSSFLFNNKATVGGLRNALTLGCRYSGQRGNFDLGGYLQGETSVARRPQMDIFMCIVLLCLCCFVAIIG